MLLPTVIIVWGIVATFQGQKLVGFCSAIFFFCYQPCDHISMLTFTVAPGFVTTYGGLITLRAILGLVEGPLSPGIFLLLSSFYTRKELSFRYVPGLLFRRRPSLHWLSRIALFLTSATVRCEVLSQMFSVSSSLSWLVLFPGYSLQQSRTWMALVEDQDGPGSLFLYFLNSFSFSFYHFQPLP